VRIAPNELSYADARAWKDIYASGSSHRCERNRTWFMKTAPSKPHSILTHDENTHARFRRAFAHSFSDRSLRDQAPVMENYVSILIEQLKSLVTSEGRVDTNIIDLNQWFNYFTFDLASDLCFGESFDCMGNKKAHLWVEITQDFGKGLALLASTVAITIGFRFLRQLCSHRTVHATGVFPHLC
jgi:cytochrome P450